MSKVRQVSFSPDEYLAGTMGMTHAERGLYWQVCALIYSSGKAIPGDDERLFRGQADNARTTRSLLERLVTMGKVDRLPTGELMVNRCRKELESAANRMSKSVEGGVKSGEARAKKARKEGGNAENQSDSSKVAQSGDELSLSSSQSQSSSSVEDSLSRERDGAKQDPDPEKVKKHAEGLLITAALGAYNAVAERHGWAKATRMSDARRSKLLARVRDVDGLEGWFLVMQMAGKSDFLTGKTGRTNGHENWNPDLDFFLSLEKFNRLVEGKYNGNRVNSYSARRAADRSAIARALGIDWLDGDDAAPGDGDPPSPDGGGGAG